MKFERKEAFLCQKKENVVNRTYISKYVKQIMRNWRAVNVISPRGRGWDLATF